MITRIIGRIVIALLSGLIGLTSFGFVLWVLRVMMDTYPQIGGIMYLILLGPALPFGLGCVVSVWMTRVSQEKLLEEVSRPGYIVEGLVGMIGVSAIAIAFIIPTVR